MHGNRKHIEILFGVKWNNKDGKGNRSNWKWQEKNPEKPETSGLENKGQVNSLHGAE